MLWFCCGKLEPGSERLRSCPIVIGRYFEPHEESARMRALAIMRWIRMTMLPPAMLLLLGIGLSGCHTSEGFGRDVESVGEDIQDEAEEAR
jgi:predicted small secreted protein